MKLKEEEELIKIEKDRILNTEKMENIHQSKIRSGGNLQSVVSLKDHSFVLRVEYSLNIEK